MKPVSDILATNRSFSVGQSRKISAWESPETLVPFINRYQKVLNLLKKHLIIWRVEKVSAPALWELMHFGLDKQV